MVALITASDLTPDPFLLRFDYIRFGSSIILVNIRCSSVVLKLTNLIWISTYDTTNRLPSLTYDGFTFYKFREKNAKYQLFDDPGLLLQYRIHFVIYEKNKVTNFYFH